MIEFDKVSLILLTDTMKFTLLGHLILFIQFLLKPESPHSLAMRFMALLSLPHNPQSISLEMIKLLILTITKHEYNPTMTRRRRRIIKNKLFSCLKNGNYIMIQLFQIQKKNLPRRNQSGFDCVC